MDRFTENLESVCICKGTYPCCNFHILFVLASFEGLAKAVRFIVLPCKNNMLISNSFSAHLFDATINQVGLTPLKHVELPVLKFCSSS